MEPLQEQTLSKGDRVAYKRAKRWLKHRGVQAVIATVWEHNIRVRRRVYTVRPYDPAMEPWITKYELAKAARYAAKLNAKGPRQNG